MKAFLSRALRIVGAVFLCAQFSPLSGQVQKPARFTPHWSKTYTDLKDLAKQLQTELEKGRTPQFLIMRQGSQLTRINLDSTSVKVLKEAFDLLEPYRDGIQVCVSESQMQFRSNQVYSYEFFGWFLDNYVSTLTKTIRGENEKSGGEETMRWVPTDRSLYAMTRLLLAYLEEKIDRAQGTNQMVLSEKRLVSLLQDISKRVLHLDLSTPFDRKELLEKGLKSQPIFQELSQDDSGIDLSLGLDPINRLVKGTVYEPSCRIALPQRTLATIIP